VPDLEGSSRAEQIELLGINTLEEVGEDEHPAEPGLDREPGQQAAEGADTPLSWMPLLPARPDIWIYSPEVTNLLV